MAEMKISELSIGDWVRYDRGTDAVQIMGIYVRNNQECVVMSDSYFPDGVIGFVECIKPIPITPEILEKNGFVKSSKYRWSNPSIGCACLRLGTKYWDIRINGRNRAYRPTRISIDNILHTHQLQNALRLAGVEKGIEL